jgi:glycosyltransferase involved in cell wall biosynthesis
MKPLVTIGLAVYNGREYIEETLNSILRQKFRNFELIIGDNASTDNTLDIIKKYAAKDKRIRYYTLPQNMGASYNHAKVFYMSQGKYFKWNSYDDKLHPDFLTRCVETLENHPEAILCYPRAIMIDSQSEIIELYTDRMNLQQDQAHLRLRQYFDAYKGHHMCNPIFGLFRKDILLKTELMGGYLSSDKILLGEIAMMGKVFEIPEYLFYYRVHAKSSMNAYNERERMIWFDPVNRGKRYYPRLRWYTEYLKALGRAEMNTKEKILCVLEIHVWAMMQLGYFFTETIRGIIWPVWKFRRKTAIRNI